MDATDQIRWNGVKTITADHFNVALQAMNDPNAQFREDQKTEEFIEIETGSEDILSQLENVMENSCVFPKVVQALS